MCLRYQSHQNLVLCVRWVESVPTSRPLLQILAGVDRVMSSGPTWDTHTHTLRLSQVPMDTLIHYVLKRLRRYLVTILTL